MTIAIDMRRLPEQPQAKEKPRGPLDSLTEIPTHLIKLSPAFLEALRAVAPKARPRRLPYFLTLALVLSIGVASGRRILLNHGVAAATVPPPAAAAAPPPAPNEVPSVATAQGASSANVATANASGGASAARPVGAPIPLSVDSLPRSATPKATKNRHPQAPR
jgi:hypothetical protein